MKKSIKGYLDWLSPDMKRRQHEYQQTIKSPNITDAHARENHSKWVNRAKAHNEEMKRDLEKEGVTNKTRWFYISYEDFLKTDFTK